MVRKTKYGRSFKKMKKMKQTKKRSYRKKYMGGVGGVVGAYTGLPSTSLLPYTPIGKIKQNTDYIRSDPKAPGGLADMSSLPYINLNQSKPFQGSLAVPSGRAATPHDQRRINIMTQYSIGGLSEEQLSELIAAGDDIMTEAHNQHMSGIEMSEGYLPIQIKELAKERRISFDEMVHRLQSNREIIQKYTDTSLKPFWVNLHTYFLIHTPKHCSGARGLTIPYLNINPFRNHLLAELHFHMMSDVGAISKEVYDNNASGIMDYKPTC